MGSRAAVRGRIRLGCDAGGGIPRCPRVVLHPAWPIQATSNEDLSGVGAGSEYMGLVDCLDFGNCVRVLNMSIAIAVGSNVFLQTDPVPGGSASVYDYANEDPTNGYDLADTWHIRGAMCSRSQRSLVGSPGRLLAARPWSAEEGIARTGRRLQAGTKRAQGGHKHAELGRFHPTQADTKTLNL